MNRVGYVPLNNAEEPKTTQDDEQNILQSKA